MINTKKTIAISIVMLLLFAGCSPGRLSKGSDESASAKEAPSQESSKPQSQTSSKSSSEDSGQSPKEMPPEKAAEELLESIVTLDEDTIKRLTDAYFAGQPIPDAYYSLLKPISERVTYKIGECKVDGDKAEVEMTITSINAQSAIDSILPGAVAHIAAMQITGKDISKPDQILAEYAAKNINWDSLPTVTTDATLYLIKDSDGKWKVDAGNPVNLAFANAISGGGIDVAKNLQSIVERFK